MKPRQRMEPPCMSCGGSKFEPPRMTPEPGCRTPREHYVETGITAGGSPTGASSGGK